MRLSSCGEKWLNSSSVFQINFSAGLTVWCFEIPHERQAQKRYPFTHTLQSHAFISKLLFIEKSFS
jgi:hypothetical protein